MVRHVASLAGAPAPAPASPRLERVLVELTQAVPRHRDGFAEPSRLSDGAVARFFADELPTAHEGARYVAYDRLLQAWVEQRHHLPYADAIASYLGAHAEARMARLEHELAARPAPIALNAASRLMRRLAHLPLSAELERRLRAALQLAHEQRAQVTPPPSPAKPVRADQLAQLLQLSPLTKVRMTFRPDAEAGARHAYRYVAGEAEGAGAVRGLTAPSEEKRGRLSKIKALLLEDDREMVDRVVRVASHRAAGDRRMRPEAYARQLRACSIARGKVAPVASFVDAKGDLHDFVPRYDGDFVDLMQVHGHALPSLGLAVGVAEEVLERLALLHAEGWGHFDVKLENVLWRRDGELALTDFGEARPLAGAREEEAFGTPGGVAPELLLGRDEASAAADLFGLGIALARLLAPAELEEVPLRRWLSDLPPDAFRDEDLRPVAHSVVEAASADYLAYQQGLAAGSAAGEEARAYQALREALVRAADPFVASLVVDALLHPEPQRRGSAERWLGELRRRYPEGHASGADRLDLLRRGAQGCGYTVRMDATFADMRLVRDGLARAHAGPVPGPLAGPAAAPLGAPPPLPASLVAVPDEPYEPA